MAEGTLIYRLLLSDYPTIVRKSNYHITKTNANPQFSGSKPFFMNSFLCSFQNFSFLPYYTNSGGWLNGLNVIFVMSQIARIGNLTYSGNS